MQESNLNADEDIHTPTTSARVVNPESGKQPALPPVIVLSDDEEDSEIPDPFPFPKTYSTNIDVSLRTGRQMFISESTVFPF